jgi:hypothetical protein
MRLLAAFLLTLLASPGYSQSLGEAAAREKAKRQKKGPSSAPVITNEELKASRPPGQKESEPAAGAGSGSSSPERGSPSGADREERPGSSDSAEAQVVWRQRAQGHRAAIAAAEKTIQDAQDKLARLMADREPIALGDPNRLQTIERMKAETRQTLEQAQLQKAEAEKALQDLEEEARRNNVPPGWLR